jgi:hypothetical protein
MATADVAERVKAAELNTEEVIGLRLYTGPLYILYNCILREFPKPVLNLLDGNKFETTIFAICSGLSNLSRTTQIPANRLLYRGLSGMVLPAQFWKAGKEGFRGGVELGLLSTTTNREVAMQYSGKSVNRAVIFEILVGRIDLGASIRILSQYPQENEFLWPPRCCLEVGAVSVRQVA